MPRLLLIPFFVLFAFWASGQEKQFEVQTPYAVVASISSEIKIDHPFDLEVFESSNLNLLINGEKVAYELTDEHIVVPITITQPTDFDISINGEDHRVSINPIPLWLSIIPPLIAILMALLFREVMVSLFAGIFIGAALIGVYGHGFSGIATGFFRVIDTHILNALTNPDHMSVIVFSMLIGSLVVIISKNGGMKGVVDIISKRAKTARSGQLATWFLGIAIFFDDYANTLIVGNTMRPVTDRLRISREKLSYLVDSTAAPIAAVAFITTWIGAELGYISDGVDMINKEGEAIQESVYSIFMSSLQFSFYPILTLSFILMLVLKRKDFGPMFHAEKRARLTGKLTNTQREDEGEDADIKQLETKKGIKPAWYNAVVPIAVVIIATFTGLIVTGIQNENVWAQADLSFLMKLSGTLGNADSYVALLWASILGVFTAVLMSVAGRILSLEESMQALLGGLKTMLGAVVILVLAWSLSGITKEMHTAEFLTGVMSGNIAPWFIPTLTFILAALIAFSTGSSWGTMAILYPLMLPASWILSQEAGMGHEASMMIFYNVVSCVLAGSVLGDHCSPISDTTILSSLATSCNHIDHVRTQLPYALTVGGAAVFLGTLPAGLGVNPWICLVIGLVVLYAVVHFFGKEIEGEKV